MPRKQTRKSISITGDAYWALKARCEKDGATMSGVAERLIREFLDLPERQTLVAKVAQAPKAKPYVPAKDIETVLKEVVGPPMVVANGMVPASRMDTIKAAADRIEARKDEPVKKVLPDDMASKIFTF